MIDFSLSDEDRLIVESIRKFIEKEVMPFESVLIQRSLRGENEQLTDAEMRALQLKAKEFGYWGLDTPASYGGADLAPVVQALIFEELGKTFVPFKFGGWAINAMFDVNDEQKKEYLLPQIAGERMGSFALSEPGVGSDARGLRTTAIRDGNEWVINGEKTWITQGDECDYTMLFARTPQEGDPEGITLFLVDRAMGYTSRPIRMMGMHDTSSLFFDNVRVPDRNVVGEVNKGFKFAMKFIHRNRGWVLGGKNVGAATRLIGMSLEQLENRTTFGKKLADRENLAFMVAESEVELRCAKMLVLNCAWRAQQDLDYRHAAATSKFYTAQMANRVVDRTMQIHGAMGYAKESGIERFYRDLRVQRIYEGSDEINLATIFRNLRRGEIMAGQLD